MRKRELQALLGEAERHCAIHHGIERPMVSVCINSHNEGPRVRATIESFRQALLGWPHEFVVVADEVTDGGCDDLMPNVTVIRNAKRKGCGRSKQQAIGAACGEVLIFLDAHQNVVKGKLTDMVMAVWKEESIFTPVVRMVEYDAKEADGWRLLNKWSQVPDPAGLRWDSTKQYRCPDDAWVEKHHRQDIQMVGVGFAISRKTLERMGGVNGYLGLHGSQERGISLRAFMAGVPVKLWDKLHLGHEFRVGKPKPEGYRGVPVGDAARNLWHCYYVVAPDDAFAAVRPHLEKQDKRGGPVLQSEAVQVERRHFQLRCRRRSSADLLRLLGVAQTSEKRPDAATDSRKTLTQRPDTALRLAHLTQKLPTSAPDAHRLPPLSKGARTGTERPRPQPARPQAKRAPLGAKDASGAVLEDKALAIIRACAKGRCLELGSGSGAGTKALLAGAKEVVSLDHLAQFTQTAQRAVGTDARVKWLTLPLGKDGFYDLALDELFDTILLDGPVGTQARRMALPRLWPHLAPDGLLLMDDGKRDASLVEAWRRQYPIEAILMPTGRGLWCIRKRV